MGKHRSVGPLDFLLAVSPDDVVRDKFLECNMAAVPGLVQATPMRRAYMA